MAAVIVHKSLAKGLVGEILQVTGYRGGDPIAGGIGIAAEAADHFCASHLCNIGGCDFRSGYVVACVYFFGDRFVVAGLVDVAEMQHATEYPIAALFASLRIGQGVES